MKWLWLYSSVNILWHCRSLGLKWKLTFSRPWPLLSSSNLLTYWVEHINSIICRIWNSSAGIPSPPLALFIVMLSKPTWLHSRMSNSRWMTTPSWLFGSLRTFLYSSLVYSCHLLDLFLFCFDHTISILYCAHPCMKVSLSISNFPEKISSLFHAIIFFYFFAFFI